MYDILLDKLFEYQRWENLIDKAELKGISKAKLRRFADPEVRVAICKLLLTNELNFAPGHEAKIPKDTPGEYRTVIVGEDEERVLMSILNDCCLEVFSHMIHPSCKSYQKGIGTGKIGLEVKEIVKEFADKPPMVIGAITDFSHYFDVVSIEAINHVFDMMEEFLGFPKGTEPCINLFRRIWASNLVFDLDGKLVERYMGIRQGNALGSFLANVIMYELDDYMTKKYKFYRRYSDDCLTIGENVEEIVKDINSIAIKYGVQLNPKKVKPIYNNEYFKFLGWTFKRDNISISKKRLKKFQTEIEKRTIKGKHTYKQAVNAVNYFLYGGEYSWASSILPIINVEEDIDELNEFVMDALRAVQTGRKKIGGLGYVPDGHVGVIVRGVGKNVTANRKKTEKKLEGYMSIRTMRNAYMSSHEAYETLVRMM